MFKFLRRKKQDPKKALQQTLGEYELPSFSAILLMALEKIRDPRSSSASVCEVLAADPGISVQILRTVNSAAFALRRKIVSVEDAIALLGMSQLESLVLSVAVRDAVPKTAVRGFDYRRFWRAAARRAATARALARLLHPVKQMESFTAGLLQDMAVPFLASHGPSKYGDILEQWHNSSENLVELERSEFSWDHAEVASWIASDWNLPEQLAVDIAGHHEQGNSEIKSLPAVSLVSCLREKEDNLGEENLIELAHSRYNIAKDDVNELLQESFEQAHEIAATFV